MRALCLIGICIVLNSNECSCILCVFMCLCCVDLVWVRLCCCMVVVGVCVYFVWFGWWYAGVVWLFGVGAIELVCLE